MPEFAVIGQPIHHSLSPRIHQYFAKACGITLDYQRVEVGAEQAADWIGHFFARQGKGLNVTLPLKEIAFAQADVIHPRAKAAKAANTLWSEQGKVHAENTDGLGLLADLQRYLPVKNAHIIILGAGGAARGIVGPLLEAGAARLAVSNRSLARAQALQKDFPALDLIPWDPIGGRFDLIINATAASLQNAPLPLQSNAFEKAPFAYDLSYTRNHNTPFLKQCQKLGWAGVDGLGMLVEQAAESFRIWHGLRPETDSVIAALRDPER